MKVGVFCFLTDETIEPAALAEALEERGLESLFVPEHTHIPASRESPYPGGGGELPREYSRTLDPFVALASAATVTDRLHLGLGICLVVERDPIVTAKEVASLDHLSRGRVLFGVGAGWNREEMRHHGTDPRTRFALMRERVQAMKALWTQEEASYQGEYVRFERAWSWPKPVQSPHPPVLVSGWGPTVLDRVVDYGDGWMPMASPDDSSLAPRVAELQERAAEAGRGPLSVTLYSGSSKPDALRRYAQLGIDRTLCWVPPAPAEVVLPRLDQIAEAAHEIG